MENKDYFFASEVYFDSLKIINGLTFTPREIDLISCILAGRGRKATALFLLITERTVETHIRNIAAKFECSTQENIREKIEKSDKFWLIRRHYLNLVIERAFEQYLKKVSSLMGGEKLFCLLVYSQVDNSQTQLVSQLKKHLTLTGIKLFLSERKSYSFNDPLDLPKKSKPLNSVIYVIPSNLQNSNSEENEDKIEDIMENISEKQTLFLIEHQGKSIYPKKKNVNYIFIDKQDNYYTLFFNLLRNLFPSLALDEIISNFTKQYANALGPSPELSLLEEVKFSQTSEKESLYPQTTFRFIKNTRWALASVIICFTLFFFLFFTYISGYKENKNNEDSGLSLVRSNLLVPTESFFLHRPEILTQIDTKFKKREGISTVALIGPGGSGKTTLARQYALQQKDEIVWEVNAETRQTLQSSLEELSQALAKSEKDQKILKGLQEIGDSEERAHKILEFVKSQLKSRKNWFLIYDNIEKMSDTQQYIPQDVLSWGKGRVILTTQDLNIKNNKFIHDHLQVGELSSPEKLALFKNIMNSENTLLFTPHKIEETQTFLSNLPPFPLDVSVAAYYIKTSAIGYTDYLKNITKNDKDFLSLQENILREAGDYIKTRCGIISLSIENIIKAHGSFEELLLFISLLDSQNIPRDLLNMHIDSSVVDNFLYHLKKYSLITNGSLTPLLSPYFSLHRSIQRVTLNYIKEKINPEKHTHYLEKICNTMDNYVKSIITKEDLSREREDLAKMKFLVAHYEAALRSFSLLNNTMIWHINYNLGQIYYFINDYKKAQYMLEKNLEKLDKEDNKNYRKIIEVLVNLGNTYRDLGNYEKGKNLLEKALFLHHQHFNEDYQGESFILTHLGVAHKNLGNYRNAKDILEKNIRLCETYLPKDSILYAGALGHLGIVYRDLGSFEKAKDFLEKSLSVFEKLSSKYHVGHVWVLVYLGNCYRNLGDYERSNTLLEQSRLTYKEHFSENSIGYAWSLASLGNLYRELGKLEKAKNFLEKSLVIFRECFGKNHIQTCRSLMGLGYVYLLKGDLKKAENKMDEALKIYTEHKHPNSYIPLEGLAAVFLKKSEEERIKGNTEESNEVKRKSLSLLKRALDIGKIHMPENSPHLQRIEVKLRSILSDPI